MALRSWRRRLYFAILLFSSLHLNKSSKSKSRSLNDALIVPNWLKLAQWFLRRGWKCEMLTDKWTARLTDNRQQAIGKVHLSFQLRWAKNINLSTTTHLYKNNLLGIAVIPWSDDDRWTFLVHHWQHHMWKEAPFEVSACMIMHKDCWWKNNPNWGFDCLNVNGLIRFYKKIQRMWLSHN